MLLKRLFHRKTVGYVSEIDQLLAEYETTHSKSPSQLAEINKYKQVYYLRDHAVPQSETIKIWEQF